MRGLGRRHERERTLATAIHLQSSMAGRCPASWRRGQPGREKREQKARIEGTPAAPIHPTLLGHAARTDFVWRSRPSGFRRVMTERGVGSALGPLGTEPSLLLDL